MIINKQKEEEGKKEERNRLDIFHLPFIFHSVALFYPLKEKGEKEVTT